jgi:FAD/FMN-containing dehydrogenase
MLPAQPLWATSASMPIVGNVTGLYSVEVARIEQPKTTLDVIEQIRRFPGRIAVGGGRYSMGGQVAVRHGLHLDMRQFNQLVWLRSSARAVRVQAGMTWRDLQEHLDPHDLAVRVMQSFANFTIGGSVSVNAHGRYVGLGPVGHTVRALQLVLADGSVIEATPEQNGLLFRAAIGGYGAVGVITEVELELAKNEPIARSVVRIPLDEYTQWFRSQVLSDPDAILHNADLLAPDFSQPIATTWRRTSGKPLTVTQRLVPRRQSYTREQNVIWAVAELPGGDRLRRTWIQPEQETAEVKWLNHEASQDVAMLEPRTRAISTYVLQEYFVPGERLAVFTRSMAALARTHRANLLNVSIRHSPADTRSLLPWAPQEVFSLVLYYKQRTRDSAQASVARWTRAMIDLALRHGGRYYLPYQLHATRDQFQAAYPEAVELRKLKSQVDPWGRFLNELWRKYL